jgi:hypothetical protein
MSRTRHGRKDHVMGILVTFVCLCLAHAGGGGLTEGQSVVRLEFEAALTILDRLCSDVSRYQPSGTGQLRASPERV